MGQVGDGRPVPQERQGTAGSGFQEAWQQRCVTRAVKPAWAQQNGVQRGFGKNQSFRLPLGAGIAVDRLAQRQVLADIKLVREAEIDAGGGDVNEATRAAGAGRGQDMTGPVNIGQLKGLFRPPGA